MKINDHPTVRQLRQQPRPEPKLLDREALRTLAFEARADDVGFVSLNRPAIASQKSAMGFPMEMDRFPAKSFVLSHKPIAVAAGLGMMGIHRNVIHPRSGISSCWGRS